MKLSKMRMIIGTLALGLVTVSIFGWLAPVLCSTACEEPAMSSYDAIYWAKDSLDGDDVQFKEIRNQIDLLLAKGDNITAATKTYQIQARKAPKNAEAQFRWAYAAFKSTDYAKYASTKPENLCGVYAAMGQPKNPRSFEYTRLRFIIAMLNSSYSRNRVIQELGIQLLHKASKDDFDLRYFGISELASTANLKNSEPMEASLHLALALQEDFPKRIEPIFLLGGVYSSRFVVTKKKSFADQSLHYMREYLQLAPNDYKDPRDWVERMIKGVEKIKHSFEQRGEIKP